VLAAPGTGVNGLGGSNSQAQATQSYDNQLAANLQALLDQAVGPGNSSVKVNATLNFSSTKSTQSTYIVNKKAPTASSQVTKEKYTGTGTVPGGTAGTTDVTGTTNGGKGKYSNYSKTVNAALGTLVKTVNTPPGQLQQLSVAVLLNKSVKGLNVPAITSLIKSGAGITSTRGDSLSVQAVAFNTSAAAAATKAAAAAQAAANSAASKAKLTSMIKQGALALLILGLAIGAWLASRKRKAAPPEPNDDVFGLDEPDEPQPQASAHPVNAGTATNPQRKVLTEVVDNRPADVARVLSGWLNAKES
jgi:flagellar M-ring protein FliF